MPKRAKCVCGHWPHKEQVCSKADCGCTLYEYDDGKLPGPIFNVVPGYICLPDMRTVMGSMRKVGGSSLVALLLLAILPLPTADANPGVVPIARSVIGAPYSWGGSSPSGFDCSGLINWAYRQIGIAVPRTSQGLARGGRPVARNSLRKGDVVTFYPGATHAALYSGGGNVIHASTYGRPVAEVPLSQAGPYHNARRYG